MKEIKTLEDALTLVPEYWPLTPGVDRWQPGDEYLNDEWYEWRNVGAAMFGRVLLTASVGRRPIPQSVREAEAYLYLKGKNLSAGETTRLLNSVSSDAIRLARKTNHPLLDWVQENRK